MEFLAGTISAHCAFDAEDLAAVFVHLDEDSSGYITKKNLEALLGKPCFLDSDDLKLLTELKNHVRSSACLLLPLCSTEVFMRVGVVLMLTAWLLWDGYARRARPCHMHRAARG